MQIAEADKKWNRMEAKRIPKRISKGRQRFCSLICDFDGEEGYFTVEASYLVPILCFLILGIMLAGIYICDLNQAKSFLNQRVTELSRNEKEYLAADLSEDKIFLKGRMLLTEVADFSITKTDTKVEGHVELKMNLSIPLIGQWIGNAWRNSFSLSVDVGNNAEWMRRWDQLE